MLFVAKAFSQQYENGNIVLPKGSNLIMLHTDKDKDLVAWVKLKVAEILFTYMCRPVRCSCENILFCDLITQRETLEPH